MRDFNNNGGINVGRDMNVIDNSLEYKPFSQCSNEELLHERIFRQGNIRNERKVKAKRIGRAALFLVVGVLVLGAITFFLGHSNLSFWIMGAGSLGIAYLSLKEIITSNQFELQEQYAVDEINLILRARRVE